MCPPLAAHAPHRRATVFILNMVAHAGAGGNDPYSRIREHGWKVSGRFATNWKNFHYAAKNDRVQLVRPTRACMVMMTTTEVIITPVAHDESGPTGAGGAQPWALTSRGCWLLLIVA